MAWTGKDFLDKGIFFQIFPGHPKLRVFITHCGQNSLSEASRAGIPVLGIPLFADQLYNAVLAEHKGMGLHVDVNTLNGPGGEEVLAAQLEKVGLQIYTQIFVKFIQIFKNSTKYINYG